MAKDIAIEVRNIQKSFKIPLDGANGLKQKLFNLLKGKRGYRVFTPLNDISLTVKKGEFFGIVGRNGSGKSTLLKTIAGIYSPDSGSIKVNGLLVPFIELGVGFNPELTGKENVYLNAALLGFSRSETELMYEKIVDFAELHDFMEEQLKNYSSGMQVRLAFSIAIQAKGDVLLLDEVLAVGDEAFQRKCFEYFAKLKRNKKTVVLVTHSMESVQQFCTKAMLIDNGEIISIGKPSKVANAYSMINRPVAIEGDDTKFIDDSDDKHNLVAANARLFADNNDKNTLMFGGEVKKINIEITLKSQETISDSLVAFTIRRDSGELIYWYSTEFDHPEIILKKDNQTVIRAQIQNIFGEGFYELGVFVKRKDRSIDYYEQNAIQTFQVVDRGQNGYTFFPEVKIDVL